MSDFVDACRSEWKRLGVRDEVADDMAAELTADLAEAEAEGGSAEDVLGGAASDPRAFARSWAVERSVARRSGGWRARRLLLAAVIAAFALVAVGGAVLVVVSSPSEPRKLALASPDGVVQVFPVTRGSAGTTYVFSGAQAPFVTPTPAPGPVAIVDEGEDSGFDARMPGLILLFLGLARVLTLTSFGLFRAARPAA